MDHLVPRDNARRYKYQFQTAVNGRFQITCNVGNSLT